MGSPAARGADVGHTTTMIQEAFQRRLNATAPTARHHGYAPALPHQNAFGALAEDDDDEDGEEWIADSVSNHLAALAYQSQMTASTAATTTQRNSQQLANIKSQSTGGHAQHTPSNHCTVERSDIQCK
jgi:hypothetical protein